MQIDFGTLRGLAKVWQPPMQMPGNVDLAAKAQVGDDMSIHDVGVWAVGGCLDRGHLLSTRPEIGKERAGRDVDVLAVNRHERF